MEIIIDNIMNWFKPFITTPQGIIFLLSLGVAYFMYISANENEEVQKQIKGGIGQINTIVEESKNKLETASSKLQKNIDIAITNLESTEEANNKLLETNEKLRLAGIQLEANYLKTVENLKRTLEAKEAALKAQDETIKSKDEVIGQLTGGNSFPRISLKKGGFHIHAQGVYSLYTVKVTIKLIPNFMEIPKNVTQNYLNGLPTDGKYIIPLFQDTFPKLLSGELAESINIKDFNKYFSQNEGDMHAIDIYIESTHKVWYQRMRIVSHNGKWEVADILREIPSVRKNNSLDDGTLIFNTVSENFPIYYPNYENMKLIILYNAGKYEINKDVYDFIEYKNGNGMSYFSFDDL